MKPSSRGAIGRTASAALAMACLLAATGGCAQSPTELVVHTSIDPTVTQPITSILVTVTGVQTTTSRVFQSLSAAAPDADIPIFYFPTILDLQLTRDGISGPVQVDVAASDPTIDATVIATASAAVTLPANKTTTVSVVLTAAPPGTGGAGGAGAGGAGGSGGGGSAGPGGAGGFGGAGGPGGFGGAGAAAGAGGA
jgi:hypothetical protein